MAAEEARVDAAGHAGVVDDAVAAEDARAVPGAVRVHCHGQVAEVHEVGGDAVAPRGPAVEGAADEARLVEAVVKAGRGVKRQAVWIINPALDATEVEARRVRVAKPDPSSCVGPSEASSCSPVLSADMI